MAVPFYMPEDDQTNSGQQRQNNNNNHHHHHHRQQHDHNNNNMNSSNQNRTTTTTTSGTSSVSSSAQQSPNPTGEDLVQAFCQALFRIGGTPMSPSSPSCSPHITHNGDVFFPRTNTNQRTPRTPRTPSTGRNNFEIPRRIRMSSISDDYDDNYCLDEMTSYDYDTTNEEFDEHFNCMAARERLQMFPGILPPRKKQKAKKEQTVYVWPTVWATAVVLVVGYGLMVIRN